jgi:hypothetical protein
MNGARTLRSEIVAVLKLHAISIFGITDIPGDKFLDDDARGRSTQLKPLQDGNGFLYAEEGAVIGPKIVRYLCSDCLARVSFLIQISTVNNYFLGTSGCFTWPSSP